MEKSISVGTRTVCVDRIKHACSVIITPVEGFPLAPVADELDANPGLQVLSIYPSKGKFIIFVEGGISDEMLLGSITRVIENASQVNDERP